jgi:hypothetical protein
LFENRFDAWNQKSANKRRHRERNEMKIAKRGTILALAVAAFTATLIDTRTTIAADGENACKNLCVVKFETKRLALFPKRGAKPKRLTPEETKAFAKHLPIEIISKGIIKGQLQIRLKNGEKHWVNDFHIKANKTLAKFTSGPNHTGVGGPNLGASRGYGGK